MSRGQIASALAVDKSVVSRWLSGHATPNAHNQARLTAHIALRAPGFTMFDWEADDAGFAARLGLVEPASTATQAEAGDLPGFSALPAFAPARHETAARGARYCGLWESIIPSYMRPGQFHREHIVIRQEHGWLAGEAIGVAYRWPMTGFIANGQLILCLADTNDFVFRQFNRVDEPIIDQVDGLMMAAAWLPDQAPTASRIIMSRLTPPDADQGAIDAALAARAAERCYLDAAALPPGMEAALVPDVGPAAARAGGDGLLRADPKLSLVRSRWF